MYIILLGIFILCFIAPIRRLWLSKLLLKLFKTALPAMSLTEQQAIESGDVWLDGQLFQGRPNWPALLALPKLTLTNREQQFINHQVSKLCAMLDDWEITYKLLDLPPDVWKYIKQEKFLALHIPIEYGGLGFSALANSTIVQKIATKSLTAAVTIMVPNSLGPGELLLNYGTEQQRQQYLPGLASGKEIPCFALTGVDAGSDATAITDTGIICKGTFAGKEIVGIKLNWNKRYITLAPISTLLGLAVKLYDPEHLLCNAPHGNNAQLNSTNLAAIANVGRQSDYNHELGITVCLLPTNLPGIEIGKRHLPLNQTFMNGPIRGRDVFVPLDYVVGGAAMIGQGWRMLVECLSAGRGISLPAISTASGKLGMCTSGAYAAVRKQFGLPIGKFEGVEAALARIGGYTYMLEATRLLTLNGIMQGLKPAIVTAISKYHMTEISRKIINDAMDVHGGRGIIMGPRNYIARAYQGIPISITVEGANILTRSLIIFGQGAIRCHPYVKKEIEIANRPISRQSVNEFDKTLSAHIKYTLGNFLRWKLHTITGFYFSSTINDNSGRIAHYCRELNRFSLALACIADVAMLVLGGKLKRKEHLSARLGDVLSYLYISMALIKYFYENNQTEADRQFLQWGLDVCLYNMQNAALGFIRNFPNRILAKGLQILLLPFGAKYKPPLDALQHKIADEILRLSPIRKRLGDDCYCDITGDDPVGRVELAFAKLAEVAVIQSKLEQAIKSKVISKSLVPAEMFSTAQGLGLITAEEVAKLLDYERARLEAIQVDEF